MSTPGLEIGPITFDQPLALGMAAVCAAALAIVLLRYRTTARTPAFFLLSAVFIGFMAAGPRYTTGDERPPNLFIIDISGSARRHMEQQWPQLREHVMRMSAAAGVPSVAVFTDGVAGPVAWANASDALELPLKLPTGVAPHRTEPWSAASVARDLTAFSPDAPVLRHAPGNIVVISDGAFEISRLADAFPGATIHTLRGSWQAEDAVRVEALHLPVRADVGGAALAGIVLSTSQDSEVEVILRAVSGGEPLEESQPFSFTAPGGGSVRRDVPLPAGWLNKPRELVVTATASVMNVPDELPENDMRSGVLVVGNAPPVLYVRGPNVAAEADPLAAMLKTLGIEFELGYAGQLSAAPATLLAWRAVILNDVPRTAIADGGESLRLCASRFGLGLFVTGASAAFGPGGYNGSALEQALPLDANPRPERPRSHALLLDASASMGTRFGNGTRFGVLASAARAYIERLDEEDSAAVIPFAAAPLAAATLTPINPATRQQLAAALAAVQPDGVTSISAALGAALSALDNAGSAPGNAAPDKRIVLISDGEATADQAGFIASLGPRMNDAGITLTVLLLNDQQPEWLAACAGGPLGKAGRLKVIGVPELGELVAKLERMLDDEQRTLLHEEPLRVIDSVTSLGEYDVSRWVETSRKKAGGITMRVLGKAGPNHPVLASWTYGEARVAALAVACDGVTSPLAHTPWLQQAVTAAMLEVLAHAPRGNVSVRPDEQAGKRVLELSIPFDGKEGEPLQAPVIDAVILGREGNSSKVKFERRSPSLWTAPMPLTHDGVMALKLSVTAGGKIVFSGITRVAAPPSAEYFPPHGSALTFEKWVQAHGGLVLRGTDDNLPRAALVEGASQNRAMLALGLTVLGCLAIGLWLRRK